MEKTTYNEALEILSVLGVENPDEAISQLPSCKAFGTTEIRESWWDNCPEWWDNLTDVQKKENRAKAPYVPLIAKLKEEFNELVKSLTPKSEEVEEAPAELPSAKSIIETHAATKTDEVELEPSAESNVEEEPDGDSSFLLAELTADLQKDGANLLSNIALVLDLAAYAEIDLKYIPEEMRQRLNATLDRIAKTTEV